MNKSCSSTQQTKKLPDRLLADTNIIITIPKDICKLECVAYFIGDDDELHKASSIYNANDLRECRNDYLQLDPDDDFFSVYQITDFGEELLSISEELNCSVAEAERIYNERMNKNGKTE